MKDVMKMPEAERRRRGKLIGAREKKQKPEPAPKGRALRKWRYGEKPIEIIG